MYYSPSLVKYPPSPPPPPSIRGNIPNVNKTLNKILQNSCSEKCQNHVWRGQGRLILYQVRQSIS